MQIARLIGCSEGYSTASITRSRCATSSTTAPSADVNMESAALSVSSEPVTVPGTTSSSEPAADTDPSADTDPAADTDLAVVTEPAENTESVADSENISPESRFSRRKSVTAGSPLVSVPVLSKTNSVTSWISWIASPLQIGRAHV